MKERGSAIGLWRIGPTGDLTHINDGGFAWDRIRALAYDPRGDAFYLGDEKLGQIVSIPWGGGSATVEAWGFDPDAISGLTFDSVGNLYVSDRANDVIWQMLVPEPGTLALGGMAGLCLLGYVWRRRKRAT